MSNGLFPSVSAMERTLASAGDETLSDIITPNPANTPKPKTGKLNMSSTIVVFCTLLPVAANLASARTGNLLVSAAGGLFVLFLQYVAAAVCKGMGCCGLCLGLSNDL